MESCMHCWQPHLLMTLAPRGNPAKVRARGSMRKAFLGLFLLAGAAVGATALATGSPQSTAAQEAEPW
jgi:hypothetical protein